VDLFCGVRTILPAGGARSYVSIVHDLNVFVVPRAMPWATRLAHRLWFRADVLRADAIVAVSHGTAGRLRATVGREADAVVPPGVDVSLMRPIAREEARRIAKRYGLWRYVLHVGSLEPRKNVPTLIRAMQFLRAGHRCDLQLALVGRLGWRRRELMRTLAEADGWVRLLGEVPDTHLPALYSAAEVVVVPSVYEGFGIPAAEARACGAKLVATDIPELHESGGPHAVYVEPSEAGLAEGICTALAASPPPPITPPDWRRSAERLACVMKRILSRLRE